MHSSDAEDMKSLRAGDGQAFRRIVGRHQQSLLAYCLRLIRDKHLAQDITQEVFLTLWSGRKKYREQGKLKHFLIKIARLRCLAKLKKLRAENRLRQRATEMRSLAEVPRYSDDAAVHEALGRLKTEHRDLLVLRHFEGFSLARRDKADQRTAAWHD